MEERKLNSQNVSSRLEVITSCFPNPSRINLPAVVIHISSDWNVIQPVPRSPAFGMIPRMSSVSAYRPESIDSTAESNPDNISVSRRRPGKREQMRETKSFLEIHISSFSFISICAFPSCTHFSLFSSQKTKDDKN